MTDHTTLTAAEREALAGAFADHWLSLMDSDDANLMADSPEVTEEAALHAQVVHAAVEHIIAARADEARADEREWIAQAIEALPGSDNVGIKRWPLADQEAYLLAIEEAARIAREGADR